jgi:hypothetical protein
MTRLPAFGLGTILVPSSRRIASGRKFSRVSALFAGNIAVPLNPVNANIRQNAQLHLPRASRSGIINIGIPDQNESLKSINSQLILHCGGMITESPTIKFG